MTRRTWLSALGLSVGILCSTGSVWGARALGAVVTGTITAPVTGLKVEVNHQMYPVVPGSPATLQLPQFHSGDSVDVELDGPIASPTSRVVSIFKHIGS